MILEKDEATGQIEYWNIMKGLGIISIVLGHSCYLAGRWVYAYHLAIFFFITGFLYNTVKWGEKPFMYLGSKMGRLVPKFMIYSSLLLALNNLLIDIGIYTDVSPMSFGNWMTSAINTMFFYYDQMGGALWFVPVLLVASGIFACIVCIAMKVQQSKKHRAVFNIIVIILSCIVGNIGILYNLARVELPYHSHTALLMLPVICAAWLLRQIKKDWEKCINIWGTVICGGILYYAVQVKNLSIELAQEQIVGPYMFYIMSFSGIYICMYFAKLISGFYPLKRVIAFLGLCSFEIMAFHFLAFKIIDLIATKLLNQGPEHISAFPTGYPNLWLIYLLGGCFIPALTYLAIKKIGNMVFAEKGIS